MILDRRFIFLILIIYMKQMMRCLTKFLTVHLQSLCKLSREKLQDEGLLSVDWAVTDGVWQKGMIKK